MDAQPSENLTPTERVERSLTLLVHASRVDRHLRNAVQVVEDELRRLRGVISGLNPYRHDHNPLNADFHGGVCSACEWWLDTVNDVEEPCTNPAVDE